MTKRLEADWAPYMRWAKTHATTTYDLAGSNLSPCTMEDLPGARDAFELMGPNDDGYAPLVESIGRFYGVSSDRVATATGASGANFLVCAALLEPGDEVLVERPAYDPLIGAARIMGARVRRFDRLFEEGFAVNPARVAAGITDRTRLIVVTSPHNPSGVLISPGALDALAEIAERAGAWVIVDEVYLDGVYGDRPDPAATRSERLISTNSLTKSYGLAGLRCGWALASPTLTAAFLRAHDALDAVGAFPAECLAHFAFSQIERLEQRARSILEPNLARLTAFVEARPELEWVPPAGGTVAFPRLRGIDDATPFVERLFSDFETAVVDGDHFEMPAHFRIAFGCPPETMEAGLERIGRALDG